MATFLNEFIVSTNERWQEVDLLISRSKDLQDSDEQLYHVLCRSITVLLVAHIEGFTKDLVKNIIGDLNHNCTFSSLPTAIKRTYCKKYIGNNTDGKNKSYENNLTQLIAKFEEVECQISKEPFYFTTNRNPNANVIKTIFNNFGISDIFYHLNESILEEMFSWTITEIQTLSAELKDHILPETENFPYSLTREEYGLNKTKTKVKTIWEEFLEQINQKRHSVAHGNIFENNITIEELEVTKSKIVLAQYALIIILASKVAEGITLETS